MDNISLKFNSKLQNLNNSNVSKLNSDKKLKELKEISNQFESIFINQILKQARKNKIENGLFDSEAISTFNTMIDENILIFYQKRQILDFRCFFNQFKSQVLMREKING